MKFPMVAILIYYILGIIVGITFQDDLVSLSLFSVAVFITIICISKYYKWNKLYFLILIYFLGVVLISYWLKTPLPKSHNSESITGIVVDIKKTTNGNTKVYIRTTEKNLKIYFIDTNNNSIKMSDTLEITGILLPLEKSINPYDFNEYFYERAKNVSFKIFPEKIKIIGNVKNFKFYLYSFRYYMGNNFDKIFEPTKSSCVKAVILGDKDDFDSDIANLFKVGGIYHILAISGLHIGLVATSLFYLIRIIIKNNYANILTLIFLILYGVTTGLSISTVRAIIMCGIFLMANVVNRKNNGLNSLMVSAFILLLIQPLYIFQAGFLLSYSAVIGIMIFSPIIEKFILKIFYKLENPKIQKPGKILSKYISPIIAAFLFTSPVICWFFYSVYPYSVFVNLIVGFTIPIFVLLSFLVGVISIFSIEIAEFIGESVSAVIDFYCYICNFIYNLPHSTILTGRFRLIYTLSFYLILFFIAVLFYKKIKKTYFFYFLSFILIFNLSILFFNSGPTITFLNNNSNCVIIKNNKNHILIEYSGNSKNIDNYFNYIGLNKLEISILPDLKEENISTTIALMEQNKVKNVVLSEYNNFNSNAFHTIKNLSLKNNIPITILKNNEKLNINNFKVFFDKKNPVILYKNVDFCFVIENNVKVAYDIMDLNTDEELDYRLDYKFLISRNINHIINDTSFLKENEDFTLRISDNYIRR